MKFWDASALVPLLLEESRTSTLRDRLADDPAIAAWWGSPVECASAVARRRRDGVLDLSVEDRFLGSLDVFRASWSEVLPGESLRRTARRLLRVHPLRAGDALQLAAALTWAGSPPFDGAEFVTLDERLGRAAAVEGFVVTPAPDA